ncbi:MAG: dipeptidase [Planctomycetia bacterium]|nr:dipeptidase [Planctomycetia bacterium]
MGTIAEYIDENEPRIQEELFTFLRMPSISSQSEHEEDCQQTARWLVDYFRKIGFSAREYPTEGHPVVLAESPRVEGAPTLLIYGHYDVQPVDPVALWESDPFEPQIREGAVYARGASDDKGPLWAHIQAAAFWMQSEQRPAMNVKFFLEGDEETGNEAASVFVYQNTELLRCDYLVLSDSPQFASGQPAITCGLRGMAYYEVKLTGPNRDLHSGMFGGAITNPCNALTRLLASLVDRDGKIQVPGFYDDVLRASTEEMAQLEMLPLEEEHFYAAAGVTGGTGEKDESVLSRIWLRPSFDIHGLSGGYQGEGSKTVLPAWASAKFSFRLVPRQSPGDITKSLRLFLAGQLPPGIQMELQSYAGTPGISVDISQPCMKAAARAVEFGFGRSPLFIREGGSIPIVSAFAEALTPHIMMIGFSQTTDNAHGPNEHLSMADFYRGMKTSARLWRELAALPLEPSTK